MKWWPDKKKDEAIKPQDLQLGKAKKTLPPFTTKYGTWCRTRLLKHNDILPLEYYEAFQQSDNITSNASKWCVRKVELREKNGRSCKEYSNMFTDLHFLEAINHMSHYEAQAETLFRELVDKTAEEIGDTHFRAFAECEGIIFDQNNFPHLRNTHSPVPDLENYFSNSSSSRFFDDDLERAEKNYQTAQETHPQRLGNIDTPLQDLFNNQAYIGNFERKLDSFQGIETFNAPIKSFQRLYKEMDSIINYPAQYIVDDILEKFNNTKTYFQDLEESHPLSNPAAHSFLNYFEIHIHLIYAQGLFQELSSDTRSGNITKRGVSEKNSAMQNSLARIEELCEKQPGFDQTDIQKIKQLVLQGKTPERPSEIEHVITRLEHVYDALTRNKANPYSQINDVFSLTELPQEKQQRLKEEEKIRKEEAQKELNEVSEKVSRENLSGFEKLIKHLKP